MVNATGRSNLRREHLTDAGLGGIRQSKLEHWATSPATTAAPRVDIFPRT